MVFMRATELLLRSSVERRTLLCVGLDTDLSRFPEELIDGMVSQAEETLGRVRNAFAS